MKKKTLFWISLVFTLSLFGVLNIIDTHLKNDVVPDGIVSFQFAKSLECSVKMINSWDGEAKVYAALSLGIDYLYLLAYGSFLAFSVLLLAAELSPGFLKKVAKTVVLMIVLASLLDGIENYASIRLLTGNQTQSMASLVYYCAIVKFAFVGIGLFYLLTGLIVLGLKKVR